MSETIESALRAAEEKAQYDAVCKRLLSEKIILAWIMHECLEEYKDIPPEEIAEHYIEGTPQISEIPVMPEEDTTRIHGVATEDASPTEGSIFYDIRFLALAPGKNELIQLIINVEAQNNFDPGYPLIKRGIYYCSRMISSQHGTEFTKSNYGKIKKVYSIWICPNPPKRWENSINRYRITEEHIVGCATEPEINYDLMTVVMVGLGDHSANHEHDLLHMLGTLLSNEASTEEKKRVLQTDFHIPMSQQMEGDVSLMCNLSEGVEQRGIRKGYQQGMRQGIQQGRDDAIIKNICAIMEEFNVTPDKAMSILRIAKEDRPRYLTLLQ